MLPLAVERSGEHQLTIDIRYGDALKIRQDNIEMPNEAHFILLAVEDSTPFNLGRYALRRYVDNVTVHWLKHVDMLFVCQTI